jgi:hypothetical protein
MTTDINARSAKPHTRESAGIRVDEPVCPTCDQPVSPQKLAEIMGKERARDAKIKQDLEARFAREKEQVEIKARSAVEQAKKEAAKVAEQQVKTLKANQDAVIAARLKAQREASEKKLAEAVNREKVKAFEEQTKLTQRLAELQRRIESKTAHELGEPAEFDLYETLRAEFPGDQISRVGKGVKGPDIILQVVHNATVTGSIAIDCKNHKQWQSVFTRKLRADQLAEGADFAILSTSSFPKGARQLHIQDNVIIADPARVSVLAHLLRRQIIENNTLKLSAVARNDKAARLYDFIISPLCTDLLDRIVRLTEDLVALDVKEADVHAATWKKRGALIVAVRHVRDEIAESLSRITHGSESSP